MNELKNRLSEKGSLSTYSDNKSNNVIKNIDLALLNIIENQPFKEYVNTPKYILLKESIQNNGISNPLIVRKVQEDDNNCKYYILSGRHRYLVAKEINLSTVPCIIKKNLTDDEANTILLDSNLCQREELLPSEKAYSYKQKLDIMNRQGKRTDLFSSDNKGELSVKVLANELNTYVNDIKQHIKLTDLIHDLLNEVDNKKISISSAYSLAFLRTYEQEVVYRLFKDNNIKITNRISTNLKELSKREPLTEDMICNILFEKPNNDNRFTKKQKMYFKSICNEYLKDYINDDLDFNQTIQLLQKALKNYQHEE